MEQAREQGVNLLGPGGLLAGLTKNVLETALEAEITGHLGRERYEAAANGNVRNRIRSKTVLSEEPALSLTAHLTTGEIAAHFDDVYGATVSKDTIHRITEKVPEEMTEWTSRPLITCTRWSSWMLSVVLVCDGQVRNEPFYIVLGSP